MKQHCTLRVVSLSLEYRLDLFYFRMAKTLCSSPFFDLPKENLWKFACALYVSCDKLAHSVFHFFTPARTSLMKQPKCWQRVFRMNRSSSRLVASSSPSFFCSHFDVNCGQFNRFYALPRVWNRELNFLNLTPWPNIEILPLFFKKLRVLGVPRVKGWGGNAV